MKNLELQNLGVLEINTKEMKEINGGFIILGPFNVLKGAFGFVAGAVADFAHGFVDGFKDGAS
ncbi:hypothetical protein GM921_12835 [Pedobacter sp. LMG 31464]|uniref:Class IIb bacteriocin, lactobin A/cerein 7B family n=1 Tax=Pedobacter planticolens TaxID=2679964 RepID=A0A923E2K3_9SPHI|nr:hypothetical protein [Pedobacter planticolens]MBB2146379.1 hypothetical protein [Pedobacter planticolens]